ncbi:MAG: hypothetical protein U1F46_07955 [Marinagarivorans sp.]
MNTQLNTCSYSAHPITLQRAGGKLRQISSLLKYVGGDGLARQIWRKNRSLHAVNEDFFAKFNAARTSKVVFQQAVRTA